MSNQIEVAGVSVSPDHYINGQRIKGEDYLDLHSPIDQSLLGQIANGNDVIAGQAVSAAHAAFPAWAALTRAERKVYLDKFADEIEKRKEQLCLVESTDAGVLLSRMQHGVASRAVLNIRYFAEKALDLENRVIETAKATHQVFHDPAGVTVIITPWNAPLMLSTWKLGPALASGNTCILKAPEWAPLTSSLLADAADAAGLPKGVFNVVQGTGLDSGAPLIANPKVSRISFTGSVPTAITIAASAAQNLVPCSLELGGKSPFIVLEDADIDNAAATAAMMYRNAGQVCLAGTRLLVHENIEEAFTKQLKQYVDKLNVGDPRDPSTEVGPIIHPRQINNIVGFIERAKADGATILWGGDMHPYGAQYFQPTLVTGLTQQSEIVQNEIFGPVLTLQTFSSDEDVISMANGTDYGLGGVCYGEVEHANKIASQVHTGFIWVNSFGIRDLNAPFGGIKRSGVGREGGEWSFEFFCNIKDVMLPKTPFRASFSKS